MFFCNDTYYEDDKLLSFSFGNDEETIINKIKLLNGNYAAIIDTLHKMYLVVDRVSTLPIFYCKIRDDIVISDSILSIREYFNINKLSDLNYKEFLAAGYTSGCRTIFDDVYMLQAGSYAIIDKTREEIVVKDYYLHKHNEKSDFDIDTALKKLDEVILNMFNRLVTSAEGRQLVLFLSGGYDSRLVAANLKRLNYEKVICVTIGKNSNNDVRVAKKIAKHFGYPIIQIVPNRRWIKNFVSSKEFKQCMTQNSYGYAISYPQGLYIYELLKQGKIPKNSIVITGNSGDMIEGKDVCNDFEYGKICSHDEVINSILKQHYSLQGQRYTSTPVLKSFVNQEIGWKKEYTFDEAQDAYEYFNWRARQAKYVVNDVANYNDILGVDWRLPLWDNEFVDYWLDVPMSMRFKRKLYYLYVKKENLPTANNVTLKQKIFAYVKKKFPSIINKYRYYARLALYFRSSDVDPLGLLKMASFKEYRQLLNYTKGYNTQWRTIYIRHVFCEIYESMLDDKDVLPWAENKKC